jgi:hypothetical protein
MAYALLIVTLSIALPIFFVMAQVWQNLRASSALGLRWYVSPYGAVSPLPTMIQRADALLSALLVLIAVTVLRLAWLLVRSRRRA